MTGHVNYDLVDLVFFNTDYKSQVGSLADVCERLQVQAGCARHGTDCMQVAEGRSRDLRSFVEVCAFALLCEFARLGYAISVNQAAYLRKPAMELSQQQVLIKSSVSSKC